MATSFQIKVDASAAKDAGEYFKILRRKQVPFATAKAQTLTARDAQRAIQGQAFNRFKLKRRGMPRAAIKMQRANKKDHPKSKAVVFVPQKFSFLELQATGGIKRGHRGRRLAIPTRIVRRKVSGGVYQSERPRKIGRRKGAHEKNGQLIHRTKKRRLGIYYLLRDSARIRPRFRFEQVGMRVIKRVWPGHFKRVYKTSLDPKRVRRRTG